MRKMIALAFVFFLLVSSALFAQNDGDTDSLKYSVLYSDTDDVTHFRDEYMIWAKTANGAQTPFENAKQMGLIQVRPGVRSDWHPAPRKQFIVVLEGVLEIEAGDGEKRRFTSGSVVLVTDTEGRGHRTNTLGEDRVLAVWVPVP